MSRTRGTARRSSTRAGGSSVPTSLVPPTSGVSGKAVLAVVGGIRVGRLADVDAKQAADHRGEWSVCLGSHLVARFRADADDYGHEDDEGEDGESGDQRQDDGY